VGLKDHRRVERRDGGLLVPSRSPPSRLSTRWRGGVSGKAHHRVETRQGGLLLGVEAPSLVFQHDWEARVVKTAPSRVSTRDGAMGGCQTGKTRRVLCVFPVRRVQGRVVGVGEVSVGLGTC